MADDIYNDILWRLRIPLPYELRGLTVQDLITERKDAADEIERLRGLIDNINTVVLRPDMYDWVASQNTEQWRTLWAAIRKACVEYREDTDG